MQKQQTWCSLWCWMDKGPTEIQFQNKLPANHAVALPVMVVTIIKIMIIIITLLMIASEF